MNDTYTCVESPATKVTVTISRRQLWENFIKGWADMAWTEYRGTKMVEDVASVLLCGDSLSEIAAKVRGLFIDGYTVFLMGDAMDKIDQGKLDVHVLLEIVVVDIGEGDEVVDSVTVPHRCICF